MKKLLFLIVAIVVLGLIVSGCLPVVPPAEQGEISSLKKPDNNNNGPKPGTNFNGPHYNLNIIGKKSDWSGSGSYSNPDRHTMFVPENTDEFMLDDSPCYTPSGTPCWAPEGANYHDPRILYPGITIWMTQYPKGTDEDEFAVLDGNAFNDCKCEFQLKSGTYTVWIVAKAKPAKNAEYYTDITGWIRYTDELTGTIYYYLEVGKVTVKKKWQNVTDELFMYSGEWVFTYLAGLEANPLYEEAAYFWQYENHGNKLVKVRFYPD